MNKQAALIANTIISQLGGTQFCAMVGVRNLGFDSTGAVSFRIMRNRAGVNAVRIELGAIDLYTVSFLKIRAGNVSVVKEFEGVYCDQLKNLFETTTGLATSL